MPFLILLSGVVATPCEMTAHRPREYVHLNGITGYFEVRRATTPKEIATA